jgi:plastocyanin
VKKLALALSLMALAAFGGVACGDEEEEDAGATVSLTADPDGLLIYDKETVTAPVGSATIEFDNPSPWDEGHDVVVVDADGKEITRTDVIFEGDTDTATGEFEAGKYTYYCSVTGHREAGMKGTLIVE